MSQTRGEHVNPVLLDPSGRACQAAVVKSFYPALTAAPLLCPQRVPEAEACTKPFPRGPEILQKWWVHLHCLHPSKLSVVPS